MPKDVSYKLTGEQWRALAASWLGWVFDAFDLFLPSVVAPYLMGIITPSKASPIVSLILLYASYLTTFIGRPTGALTWGHVADRLGRRRALIYTVIGYALTTGLTGLLPTYAQVGLLTIYLYALLRFLTGFFCGGEWAVGQPFSMEHARYGWTSGLVQSAAPIGNMLAVAAIFVTLSAFGTEGWHAFAWRLVWFYGLIPALLALYVRLGVRESPKWENIAKEGALSKSPIKDAFKFAWKPILLSLIITTGLYYSFYTVAGFITTYLTVALHIPGVVASKISIIVFAVEFVAYVLAGFLADFGRKLSFLVYTIIALVITFPFYFIMNSIGASSIAIITLLYAILVFFATGMWGVLPVYLSERFPTKYRATAAGFIYNGGGIIGSFATLITLAMASHIGLKIALPINVFIGLLLVLIGVLVNPETKYLKFE